MFAVTCMCNAFMANERSFMKVLLTGFDPFGGENINPAYEAVKLVSNEIEAWEIIKIEIPTVFRDSVQCIKNAIEEHQPEMVLCIGQAGGSPHIAVERVGINVDDARIPDNAGNQPIDEPIFEDGENAYFSNLPIKKMVAEMSKAGLEAVVSNSAGTYVCNHVLYSVMYMINKQFKDIRGGFIHVPFIPEQTVGRDVPSMPLNRIVQGLEIAIKTAIVCEKDEKLVGGSIF